MINTGEVKLFKMLGNGNDWYREIKVLQSIDCCIELSFPAVNKDDIWKRFFFIF